MRKEKHIRKNHIKEEKGITLIALVLTIIILIILAGIGISIFTGEDGIVNKAKRAAQNYQSAADEEKNTLDSLISGIGEKPFIDNAGSTSFGKDTSNYDWSTSTGTDAKLDLGETVNLRLKKIAALANGKTEEEISGYTVYNSEDTYITSIVWSNTEPTAAQKVNYGQLAMTPDSALGMDADGTTNELIVSDVPIYAWYENGTIYIWSSDTTIDMHPHSERMFQGMKNLQNISGLSHFVADNVTSVRYMFKDTNISNFAVCNNWNVRNVKTSLKAGQESLPGNNGFYQMCKDTVIQSINRHPRFTQVSGWWDEEGTLHFGLSNVPYKECKNEKITATIRGRQYTKETDVTCLAVLWANSWGGGPILVSPNENGVKCSNRPYTSDTYTLPNGEQKTFYYSTNDYAMAWEGGECITNLNYMDFDYEQNIKELALAIINSYGAERFFNDIGWYYSATITENGDYYKGTVSDMYENDGPWLALDNNERTQWGTESGNHGEHWLQIEFREARCIKSYYLFGGSTNGTVFKFCLQASNNGSSWTNLEGSTMHTGRHVYADNFRSLSDEDRYTISLNNNNSYKYYRVYFSQGGWTWGSHGAHPIVELQLRER